jgi:hypothetical protein
MESRTVVVFGQSLLLSLVEASLGQNENLRVVHADRWEEIGDIGVDCTPDVIIYDLDGANGGNLLPLSFKNPHILLIGLDTEYNHAVLLVGQETSSLTLERVKEIIRNADAIKDSLS